MAQVEYAAARSAVATGSIPAATPDPGDLLDEARTWLRNNWDEGPCSCTPPPGLMTGPWPARRWGRTRPKSSSGPWGSSPAMQSTTAPSRVVVAGGETSGAVVQALGPASVVLAAEEDPGVPWCLTRGEPPLALLLKSGNFGRPDLLVRALSEPVQ